MATKEQIALIAHLMRRAGFGAPRSEIEAHASRGYKDTVEWLLHPEEQPELDELLLYRYHPTADNPVGRVHGQFNWLYRMVNTPRPLEEKTALFWHHVFATGLTKVESVYDMVQQVQMFREHGLGNYRDLLQRLARDPSMLFWLDNQENHKRAPNENWGRELLELFSLGVGYYTEDDVKQTARAFTGWTMGPKIPSSPWGQFAWSFDYRPEDHDNSAKTFLGHKGHLNGDDVIEIIVSQPACARFIARHLYNFFVADEPQVPAWPFEPPQDPDAIDTLANAFVESDMDIREVLRVLFNSGFFKSAMYRKVKSPAEFVAQTLRLTGDLQGPDPRWFETSEATGMMGQEILDPPSVEGWHTGKEWVNSGAMMLRVNYVADRVSDLTLPGVQEMVQRIAAANGTNMKAEELVEHCLDLAGPVSVSEETREELVDQAQAQGDVSWAEEDYAASSRRVGELMAVIAGTKESQFG